jgi:hypothetical protein
MFSPILPYAADIRKRCLATLPVVAVIAGTLGLAVARADGTAFGATALWFVLAFCVTSYASGMLEAATLAILKAQPGEFRADFVGFGWDLCLGALTGLFLSAMTSASLLQAASFASAVLFLERLIIEKLFFGNLVGDSFVGMLQGGGLRSAPGHSLAAAHAARGDIAAASSEYQRAITGDPRDPGAYLAWARMLREARDSAGAADVLMRALANCKLDARTSQAVLREVAELHMYMLNDPGRAATIVARYIDQHAGEDVEWARQILKRAKALALDPGDPLLFTEGSN